MTTEPIEFSVLVKLDIGPVVVLDYFVFRFKSLDCLKLFLLFLSGPSSP